MTRATARALALAVLWLASGRTHEAAALSEESHSCQAAPPPGVRVSSAEPGVPPRVVHLGDATVAIGAGEARSRGFFVAPGLVVAGSTPLGGRTVVPLLTVAGRSGLAQLVARDAGADLVVLRVHPDLTPGAVLDAGGSSPARLPPSAFLVLGGAGHPTVERVLLGASSIAMGIRVVEVSAAPAEDAAGAPCVGADGRLLGVVTSSSHPAGAGRVALVAERIRTLMSEARRATDAAPAGRPAAARPQASSGTSHEAPAESETERARREGADAFERAAGRLEREREACVEMQTRYDAECVGTYMPVFTVPGTGWPYPGGYVIEKSELPECRSLRDHVDARVGALRRNLADAEEQARRAGVYPGTVRDIKRAHGLDAVK